MSGNNSVAVTSEVLPQKFKTENACQVEGEKATKNFGQKEDSIFYDKRTTSRFHCLKGE